MKRRTFIALAAAAAAATTISVSPVFAQSKEIVYLAPALDVPFWRTVAKGVEAGAKEGGYSFQALEAQNNAQKQLTNAQDAITRGVAGIVISPTDSSTAPSVLKLAAAAKIPVVICDIGTTEGEYVSFIASDNTAGAKGVGEAVAAAAKAKGMKEAPYGMITISLARINGQKRTDGFRSAMEAGGYGKEIALQQMQAYTADESFKFAQDMLTGNPNLKAMFIEADTPAMGALRAIKASNRSGDIIVGAFDGIPEFVDLLKSGELTAAGMQQPWLMGETAAKSLTEHLAGKTPPKEVLVPVMIATSTNIEELLPEAKKNVFGE
ncbi:substrate-binding domain-containing protein [Mesorhizobium sp. IMUNJ 23033]|uniref:substrate-binding domain-containing protein n=1 Tax=Mesorhizobium sp. IMUNJ 23033 TaxID=3378039 RepID=UPI003850F742